MEDLQSNSFFALPVNKNYVMIFDKNCFFLTLTKYYPTNKYSISSYEFVLQFERLIS